jgi:hypothetical protein
VKLEYLADGSPDCPLIRLYDFTPAEAMALRKAVAELASQQRDRLELQSLPWVDSICGCRLTLKVESWDQAVVCKTRPPDFECGLTAGTWDNVAALIEPFAARGGGFQWLTGAPVKCSLLLSCSGQW